MRSFPASPALLFIGLLACLPARPALAVALDVAPVGGGGKSGHPFVTDIAAKGGSSVGAMQFDLTWDPAVLEFKSLDKAKVLADNAMVESKLRSPGRLSVAWVAQDSVDADGPLLTVQFVAKGQAGQKSPLALQNLRAWGPDKAHHGSVGEQHLIDVQTRTFPAEVSIGTASGAQWYLWVGGAIALIALAAWILKSRGSKRSAG